MGNETMGSYGMKSARRHTKGFTLIASLLLLLLLSGIAIGLMMMVTTEGKVGGTDLQNNIAYHTAEGGIEKMSSDLATTFQNVQAPSASQICALGGQSAFGGLAANEPALPGVTWTQYQVTPGVLGAACPTTLITNWGQIIGNGQNKNLWAQIIPVNMLATAALPGGQEVSMMRSAQVSLIPVFQFGVFSDSDLAFFPGSNLDFAGPVHTNGDLYPLAGTGATVTFHYKVSAFGNIIRTRLPNGYDSATNYAGNVYVPTADGNCTNPGTAVAGNCLLMPTPTDGSPYGDSSVTGAGSSTAQPASSYNYSNWTPFSHSSNYEITNGNYGSNVANATGTGATKLSMPFVNGTTLSNELIRRPETTDSTSLSQSREYNMAQIHVLLSDDPAELPGGATDANNVRLANITQTVATATGGTASNPYGIQLTAGSYPNGLPAAGAGNTYNQYFAAASNEVPYPGAANCAGTACNPDWPYAPLTPAVAVQTLQPLGKAPIDLSPGAPAAISLCPPANTNLAVYVPTPAVPANCGTALYGAYPYYVPPNGPAPSNSATSTQWNLIDGYLRVEYKDATGNWHPITNEWLQLGFARGITPPTLPGTSYPAAGTNQVNPTAILLLQEPADRNADGAALNLLGTAPVCNTTKTVGSNTVCKTWTPGMPPEVAADTPALATAGVWEFGLTPAAPTVQSITQYNWYPINFYDVREGEVRDNTVADNSCTTNGVMNAVEIDVGNLKQWLLGNIGTSGTSVDYKAQNGYVLYFSDRRGMLVNPNLGYKSGDAGLEDVINYRNAAGTPDGLDPVQAGKTYSPEDVNENGVIDSWGGQNLGLGFWGTQASTTTNLNTQINSAAPPDPFGTAANARIKSCGTTGRKNWVSGARHVLRLVDGSIGNVPLSPVATVVNGVTYNGGFTVAAENPVYIWGDYNTNQADWNGGVDQVGKRSSASVIADAVTLLSVDWNDYYSTVGKVNVTVTDKTNNRNPSHDGYFRVAVAGGKNMNFLKPTWAAQDFGTDGGVHNFLRYLEDWSNQTVHYKGSLVSLYYATYDTGIFKCCTVVYGVPTRNYIFDSVFSVPAGLPPGTPMFKDVDTLSYRQFFAPRIAGQ